MFIRSRRTLVASAVAGLACLAAALPAAAQNYPTRPITMIVPWGAGGGTDAVARIVAPAGEFIGAQTPEEIALSVLTSVVAARRGREPAAPAAQADLTGSMASPASSAPQSSAAASAAMATSCCSTPAATEPKEATKTKALAPVAASACCGGSKQAAGQAAATATDAVPSRTVEPALALAAVPASAKSSCCGG